MITISTGTQKDTYPIIVGLGLDDLTIYAVEKFLGIKLGKWVGRRRRKTASPEFTVMIRDDDDNFVAHDACIVVNTAPSSPAPVQRGPVGVGMVLIDEQEWYFLVMFDTDLYPSEVLVCYDGEPEDLLHLPHLFDVE